MVERNALKEMLRASFRYTSAVSMQWVLFGSGGHKDPPKEGQLAGFQRCTGVLSKQMKCLGNAFWLFKDMTFRPTHVHQCTLRCGPLPLSLSHSALLMRECMGAVLVECSTECSTLPEHALPEHARPEHARPEHALPEHARPVSFRTFESADAGRGWGWCVQSGVHACGSSKRT